MLERDENLDDDWSAWAAAERARLRREASLGWDVAIAPVGDIDETH